MLIHRGAPRSAADPGLATAIHDKAVALNPQPRTVELTYEKALRVREAIKQGDYSTAEKISADILAGSRLQRWRFFPFSDFISSIADLNDPAFETHLNEWVARDAQDPLPVLIRAQYHYDIGWFKRGHGFVQGIQASNLATFGSHMKEALADVDTAIHLNDNNPYGHYLKLIILRGSGMTPGMQSAFEAAIKRYPDYYPLYDVVLRALEPRWGGTVPAMYAFVARHAGHAAEHSPLKLLYLSLYRDLLGAVSTACASYSSEQDKQAQCVAAGMQKIVTPQLESQVLAALQLYDHSDQYEFGLAVDGILFDMLKASGGDTYSGAILQLAATSMHSDTQLKQDAPGHNNYIIDKAVAESWHVKGFFDNALKKDQEALRDLEATAFPSEEEKDVAIAGIYGLMAETYDRLHQYADMMAYAEAAIAIGGTNDNAHLICFGYYHLKNYDEAVRTCTKTVNETGNLFARYLRGSAYRDLGQPDDALKDFTVMADSEDSRRATSAIDISMIYFNRNDVPGALNVLNKYAYLYDPRTTNRYDVAVSYNNRCYAYMQLGELSKALDDCTASLKFGSLPDAYRKQQELIKRLGPA